MNKQSNTVATLKALLQLMEPSDASVSDGSVVVRWQHQTEESLTAARNKLAADWRIRFCAIAIILSGLFGFALVALSFSAISFVQGKTGVVIAFGLLFSLMGGLVGSLLGIEVFVSLRLRHVGLKRLLDPAHTQPERCETAALLVEKDADVCEYRDAVVGAGRSLVLADLDWMQILGSRNEKKAFAETQRLACLKLHGVGPT